MSRIAIIGTGYVGLVTGACLADFGLNVICVDTNEDRINSLKNFKVPFYEPELGDLVERNARRGLLYFTDDLKYAVENSEVIFITVGTPPKENGYVDLRYIFDAAESIALHMNDYKVIVDKSTVPVGTGKQVKTAIQKRLKQLGKEIEFDVVSNPEFLREGTAIYDFTHPDKVVIGSETERSKEIMKNVYRVLYLNEAPFIFTNLETAELIKYANNSFLALKISFINEIATLCEKVNANVQQVASAIGKDGRIGSKFLHPGPGFGGSCFPKDVLALASIAQDNDIQMKLVDAVIQVNNAQRSRMVQKVEEAYGNVRNKTLAVLGLSFKPKTDDMREASSVYIIRGLADKGAKFRVFDPKAMEEAKKYFKEIEHIEYCMDEYDAINGSNGLIIITEWHQFRNLSLDRIKDALLEPYFFDLRNIYDKQRLVDYGFKYYGVGV